ncbi:MAG: hypothetical protein RRZ73_04570, partial [Oscillospiraceae bacterium]
FLAAALPPGRSLTALCRRKLEAAAELNNSENFKKPIVLWTMGFFYLWAIVKALQFYYLYRLL